MTALSTLILPALISKPYSDRISEWKAVQFPEKGLVYDYFVDEAQCIMVPWEDKVRHGALGG
jgi:hypothetical protein